MIEILLKKNKIEGMFEEGNEILKDSHHPLAIIKCLWSARPIFYVIKWLK